MMAYVLSEYLLRWFKQHPKNHRTDQQGTRIVCPTAQKFGHPATTLQARPSHITKCPFCQSRLGHVQPILDDQDHTGEYQWPTAA